MKIYTKTGDGGKTSLLGGTKVWKSDLRVECYGTVDELNAHIGMLRDLIQSETVIELTTIQHKLFIMGSLLANDPNKSVGFELPILKAEDVAFLEKSIDRMSEVLPEMRHFILPGGSVPISQAHICRCVCRRAERLCVALQETNEFDISLIIQYLNRLSDYLFVVARYIAFTTKTAEIIWKY